MIKLIPAVLAALFVSGCAAVRVPVHSYSRVAVVGFEDPSEKSASNRNFSERVKDIITGRGYYRIIDRDLRSSLESAAPEWDLPGVDAVIIGRIDSFGVEKYEGTETVVQQLRQETARSSQSSAQAIKLSGSVESISASVPSPESSVSPIVTTSASPVKSAPAVTSLSYAVQSPPGLQKKEEASAASEKPHGQTVKDTAQKNTEKSIPPGQQKKAEDSVSSEEAAGKPEDRISEDTPHGHAVRDIARKNKEKNIPPGQQKKAEDPVLAEEAQGKPEDRITEDTPHGQTVRNIARKNKEKSVPPGQQKKAEDSIAPEDAQGKPEDRVAEGTPHGHAVRDIARKKEKKATAGLKEKKVSVAKDKETAPEAAPSGAESAEIVKSPDLTVALSGAQQTELETVIREVQVSVDTMAKKGHFSAGIRMLDAKTGRVLQSRSSSLSEIHVATSTAQAINMPSDERIIDSLQLRVINELVNSISPGSVGENRYILRGRSRLTKTGFRYARSGLWEEAAGIWRSILGRQPQNGYALNNMGVLYEKRADIEKSAEFYGRALEAVPGNNYIMFNLRRAREVLSLSDAG